MSSDFISPAKKIFLTGHELRLLGNFELAIDLFKDLLSLSASEDSFIRVDALNELVTCYRALHQYEESMEYTLEALRIAERINYTIGKANALLNLGALAHLSNSLLEAKNAFRESLKIFESNNGTLGVARVLVHLGLVSRDEGMIEKAEGDLYTAYKLVQNDFNDPEYRYVIIRILNHLGHTKLLSLNITEGIKIFKDSLVLTENTKDESKKPFILRNLALCYLVLDLQDEFNLTIKESIRIAQLRKQTYEVYFANLYTLLNAFFVQDKENVKTSLVELQAVANTKYSNYNFFIYFLMGMIQHEHVEHAIQQTLSSIEQYYRENSQKIKNQKNLILLEIETLRLLSDQITAQRGGYSFGITRKFEKLIRIARGHKEERILLLLYSYLLELFIPKVIEAEKQIKDESYDPIKKLIKQIKSDISNQILSNLFGIIEALIKIYYTMEFSESINGLITIKNYFANHKMTELELQIFKLETRLSENLAKLSEISEHKNLELIKRTVLEIQTEVKKELHSFIRYFKFKVLQILFLLNDVSN